MRQALRPGALGRPRGSGWRGRWEGVSGWGTHVNPWLFHFNVWQNSLQKKKKKKWQNDLCSQSKPFSITVIHVCAPASNSEEAEVEQFFEDIQDLLELTQKRCPIHYRGLDCKVGSQEIAGITGKFCHGVQNKAGQKLTEFCQENGLVITNTLFQQHKRRVYTQKSPMVNIKLRLFIFFAAKDGETLYSQQKQDQDLTVAQIMNFLLPNSGLNWRK